MNNEEVKVFWLKHEMKPRVQFRIPKAGRLDNPWQDVAREEPIWHVTLEYRIHPDDLEKFMKQETKPIDWTKPLMFRNKPERTHVRFVSDVVTARGVRKLCVFTDEHGFDDVAKRNEDGRYSDGLDSDYDIINAPEVKVLYRNAYGSGVAGKEYDTAEASEEAGRTRCGFEGVLRFTYKDGKLTRVELV